MWGFTGRYDPVLLKQTGVLVPGLPELQAKYHDCIYSFQNQDTNNAFLEDPDAYVGEVRHQGQPLVPPPIRLCVMGPRGSGKTAQASKIAEDNNIFHISFHLLVQEKLLKLSGGKKRVGSEFDEANRLIDEQAHNEKSVLEAALDAIVYPPSEEEESPKAKDNALAEDEEEEAEERQSSDREIAYETYLSTGESIPHEFLDEIIAPFWRDAPYVDKGFVLEGFPSCSDDVRYLVGNGLFPDAVIVLNCEERDIIKRCLNRRLEPFVTFHNMKQNRLNQLRERKLEVRDAYVAAQITQTQAEQEGAENPMSEEEIRMNVEQYFQEDWLEVEDPHPESIDEAEERLKIEMTDEYSVQQEQVNNSLELLEEAQIPRHFIDATRKIHQVYVKTLKEIEPYLRPCRQSMFERVVQVTMAQSDALLRSGYLSYSSFGRWDPVALKQGNVFRPRADGECFPLAYGPYIYYCYTQSTKAKFIKTPLEYISTSNQVPAPPTPVNIAIVGPPKAGKSTLARRFAAELGLVKLSPVDVIELLLAKYPKSLIAEEVHAELVSGVAISNALLYRGLDLILMDERAQTRGYVLDGLPMTKAEFDILQRRSIVPFRLIELEITLEEALVRTSRTRKEKELLRFQLEMARLAPKSEDDEEEEEEEVCYKGLN